MRSREIKINSGLLKGTRIILASTTQNTLDFLSVNIPPLLLAYIDQCFPADFNKQVSKVANLPAGSYRLILNDGMQHYPKERDPAVAEEKEAAPPEKSVIHGFLQALQELITEEAQCAAKIVSGYHKLDF